MKLLYIHQYFSTPCGSTGTRSYEFARRLVARGHDVTILCSASSGSITGLSGRYRFGYRTGLVEGFQVIELYGHYSNKLSRLGRFAEFIRFVLFSTVYSLLGPRKDLIFSTSPPLTVAFPALAASWLRKTPFVFEVRDSWPDILVEMGVLRNKSVLALAKKLELQSYQNSHALVALAPGVWQQLKREEKLAHKVYFVPNGCDVDLFRPSGAEYPHSFSPDKPMKVVYSGSHGLANGLDFVLHVAQSLQEMGIANIRFVLIGDGKEKERLRRITSTSGLVNIEFQAPLPKNKLAQVLPRMSIGMQILSSTKGFQEGTSPNKFFDYLASGLPVITNYEGWVSGLVTDAGCGWVAGTEKEFARKLVDLSANPGALALASIESRKLAVESFQRADLAATFCQILEEVF